MKYANASTDNELSPLLTARPREEGATSCVAIVSTHLSRESIQLFRNLGHVLEINEGACKFPIPVNKRNQVEMVSLERGRTRC
jgi:hypothetical protein